MFRGWYVWPDELRDADGEPVNAVHGFASALTELLESARPSHLAAAFDESHGRCARREIYPDYKANRPSAPESLKRQFRRCRELLRACGIAEFASPRYEADDIIATLAGHARGAGLRRVLVSADKDLAQLIDAGDIWWDLARGRRLDARGVEKHFGAPATCLADMLALAGDRIDNIPGVPGIGMATAARLLCRFGDIDSLYARLDEVAGMKFRGAARVRGLLDEHRDSVLLARRLTHALHDDSLSADMHALRPRPANAQRLEALFDQLQLPAVQRRRLLAALQGLPDATGAAR